MNEAYISLGSNMGNREQYLFEAVHLLQQVPGVIVEESSSLYETEPVGVTDQKSFLNMVTKIQTELSPVELLEATQEIENKLQRVRVVRWGPRTIDLDILLYNKENIEMSHLNIPHPRMMERAFVLIPLQELAPHLILPGFHITIDKAVDQLSDKDKEGVSAWKSNIGQEEFGHTEN
ncbi:2-amino-4-hydroxy-6-hydroxymethyldihydropteridine diphosphokinase [Thalassorhabdus alkalitolerans]|uniref:2-amino-4-hydroxy-6-hydroxymethyldihydropteridine diphosphokinase n=1 Tax=Thalassorhabdus alkalitolerans TaxID=2282697 RepID=A0ABW0YWR4_9BACI